MNLLDPTTITPEVIRRALILYQAEVRPGARPFLFEDGGNDLGIDGRFNLSMLGRFLEEALLLDACALLKPDCDVEDLERIVRSYAETEHTRAEHERFMAALKTALGMKRHEVQGFIDLIRQQMTREENQRLDEARAAEREAKKIQPA